MAMVINNVDKVLLKEVIDNLVNTSTKEELKNIIIKNAKENKDTFKKALYLLYRSFINTSQFKKILVANDEDIINKLIKVSNILPDTRKNSIELININVPIAVSGVVSYKDTENFYDEYKDNIYDVDYDSFITYLDTNTKIIRKSKIVSSEDLKDTFDYVIYYNYDQLYYEEINLIMERSGSEALTQLKREDFLNKMKMLNKRLLKF